MDKILNYLKDCDAFFLATSEENIPRIRPFLSMAVIDGRLCLCTGNKKAVYRQMMANPSVALCMICRDGKWIRMEAKAVDVTTEETQQKMLEQNADLAGLYAVNDGNFAIICLQEGLAEIHNHEEIEELVKF